MLVLLTVEAAGHSDTIKINRVPTRLAALDCPETDTTAGRYDDKRAKKFARSAAFYELTGAQMRDHVVGCYKINGADFGEAMMRDSDCNV